MKWLLSILCLFPALSFGAPFDFLIQQKNIADSATFTRVAPLRSPNVTNILATDQYTNLPMMVTLGQPFGVFNGQLEVSLRWDEILNAPTLVPVATSGDYNDLTNKPSIDAQVNSDWSAMSGAAEIINKPSLAAVATSGSYSDLSGKPTIPASQVNSDWSATSGSAQILNKPVRTQSSATRALNTAFQISSTRDAMANYSVQCVITASIAGGQSCDVILEIATDSGFTTGVQTLGIVGTGQTYTLAIALQGVQPQTEQLTGYVPAGYYARIRTVSVTGAPTFSYRAGQEILQ